MLRGLCLPHQSVFQTWKVTSPYTERPAYQITHALMTVNLFTAQTNLGHEPFLSTAVSQVMRVLEVARTIPTPAKNLQLSPSPNLSVLISAYTKCPSPFLITRENSKPLRLQLNSY